MRDFCAFSDRSKNYDRNDHNKQTKNYGKFALERYDEDDVALVFVRNNNNKNIKNVTNERAVYDLI